MICDRYKYLTDDGSTIKKHKCRDVFSKSMDDLFEDIIYVSLTYFLLMFEMGLSIGFLILGVFTTYFGLGKTKKIGIILSVLGLCGFVVIVVTDPGGVSSDWWKNGILSSFSFATGIVMGMLVISMTILKMKSTNKEDEFVEIKDSDLEEELKKLEQEMNEGENSV